MDTLFEEGLVYFWSAIVLIALMPTFAPKTWARLGKILMHLESLRGEAGLSKALDKSKIER